MLKRQFNNSTPLPQLWSHWVSACPPQPLFGSGIEDTRHFWPPFPVCKTWVLGHVVSKAPSDSEKHLRSTLRRIPCSATPGPHSYPRSGTSLPSTGSPHLQSAAHLEKGWGGLRDPGLEGELSEYQPTLRLGTNVGLEKSWLWMETGCLPGTPGPWNPCLFGPTTWHVGS